MLLWKMEKLRLEIKKMNFREETQFQINKIIIFNHNLYGRQTWIHKIKMDF